jgi:hypothetical protein
VPLQSIDAAIVRLLLPVSYRPARSHFGKLEAPVKGSYAFRHSAHSPLFEETDRMREIMRADVQPGSRGLADQEKGIRPRDAGA